MAVEIISDSEFSPSLHRDNHHVRLIMEGLFAHFFSAERQSYHRDDVQWFLQLANEQGQWRSHSFEQLVVSGGLEEDLMSKMEKTFDAECQRQASHKVEVFTYYMKQNCSVEFRNFKICSRICINHWKSIYSKSYTCMVHVLCVV